MIAHQTLFMHATNIPNLRFESSGHPSPDGDINILENFSEIRNTLDLTCLPENNHEAPCFPHFNEGNSSMDGFSSFFALSKTEYYELAARYDSRSCHHWVQQGVNRQSHDTEGNSKHSSQWWIPSLVFWLSIRYTMTLPGNHVVICLRQMPTQIYLFSIHY
jgi:hypothetical protein